MDYTILETHIIYEQGQLAVVAVLWKDNEYVRATISTNKPIGGYYFLPPNTPLTDDLLQTVAGAGMYIDEKSKRKYFPGKRNWSR